MGPRVPSERRNGARHLSNTDQDKHGAFTAWAKAQGVEIDNVAPKQLPGRGLGLVATKKIKQGSRILFIPESTIFKPQNALLKQHKLDKASSQAKLAISSLAHFAPQDATERVWRETWPTEDDMKACMPIYWPSEPPEALLSPIQAPLRRQRTDYQRDWLTCTDAVRKLGFDETDFKYYWMIVNSRSFHWAPPSGRPGHMVLCPFIDYLNHGPTGSGCEVIQRSDGYEVIAQRAYTAGEEILASYGAHSNDKLLIHYGFTLSYDPAKPSADDEIRIDKQILEILSDEVQQQLLDLGYLAPYALVPCVLEDKTTQGWEPCFKTQVAIRATFQSCNEWEFYAENGQDLSGDSSGEVVARLNEPLRRLLLECETALACCNAAEVNAGEAERMLSPRWGQIKAVIEWYLDAQN